MENSNNCHIKLYFRTKLAPEGGEIFGGAKILGLEKMWGKRCDTGTSI